MVDALNVIKYHISGNMFPLAELVTLTQDTRARGSKSLVSYLLMVFIGLQIIGCDGELPLSHQGNGQHSRQSSSWHRLLDDPHPPPSERSAFAYDPHRMVFVLYQAPFKQIWEYTSTTGWYRSDIDNIPGKEDSLMKYHPKYQQMMLICFDDYSGKPAYTYLYDGNSVQLIDEDGPASNFAIRPTMAYDAFREKMVLTTGHRTWEWQNNHWELVDSNNRHFASPVISYDPQSHSLIMVDFSNAAKSMVTLRFDGTQWKYLCTQEQPSKRFYFSLESDDKRVLLFGGRKEQYVSSTWRSDLWSWNGKNWTLIKDFNQERPLPFPQLSYKVGTNEYLLYTSLLNAYDYTYGSTFSSLYMLWEDRIEEVIKPIRPMLAEPKGYNAFSPTYKDWVAFASLISEDALVLLSFDLNYPGLCTWKYRNGEWELLNHSLEMTGGGTLLERTRQATLYYFPREQNPSDSTFHYFELIENQWVRKETETMMRAREDYSVAYEPTSDRFIFFGGAYRDGTLRYSDETWAFDGQNWRIIETAQKPLPRIRAAMTYYPERDLIVLHGGNDIWYYFYSDTWIFHDDTWEYLPLSYLPYQLGYFFWHADYHVLVYVTRDFDWADDSVPFSMWAFSNNAWMEWGTLSFEKRYDTAITYMPFEHKLLLFGGSLDIDEFDRSRFSDLWEYEP